MRADGEPPLSGGLLPGMLAATRHAEVVELLHRPDDFSSRVMRPADTVLLGADGEAHRRARAWVSGALAALPAARLRAAAERAAARLVRALPPRADLVEDLAKRLPVELTAALLGLPGERMPDLRRWSAAVVAQGTGTAPAGEARALAAEQHELADYLAEELARRRARPGADLLSALLRDPPPGFADDAQLVSVSRLLVIASHETTSGLIAAAAQRLLRSPALPGGVAAEPRLLNALVEETLRCDSPVQFVYRVAARETRLAATRIPEGALLVAVLGSANRDERRFRRPDAFDLARRPPYHVAFGTGPHACLGAQLARIEARAALAALASAGPWRCLEAAEELPWRATLQLRAPARLLVERG